MRIGLHGIVSKTHRTAQFVTTLFLFLTFGASAALAQPEQVSGEANLKLPDLSSVQFLGMNGHNLLLIGILFCIFGLGFGLVIYSRL
jgi:K(+)-stimulated pyrophosphate-energized sodium pump